MHLMRWFLIWSPMETSLHPNSSYSQLNSDEATICSFEMILIFVRGPRHIPHCVSCSLHVSQTMWPELELIYISLGLYLQYFSIVSILYSPFTQVKIFLGGNGIFKHTGHSNIFCNFSGMVDFINSPCRLLPGILINFFE